MLDQEEVEVRLLGQTSVVAADGHAVAPEAWTTSKTVDLLRLLALAPGHAVDIELLLAELWPQSPEERARASLRTATYQVRRALGERHVQRAGSSLVLHDVWVDAEVYVLRAAAAAAAHRRGSHGRAVRLVNECEGLYLGDLDEHHTTARLSEAAGRLRLLRQATLLLGAESALELGWVGDAHELAASAFEMDRHVERAARLLMRALAGLGEVHGSLMVFAEVQRHLRTSLGVDPAPQTRSVQLQVLTGMSTISTPAPAPPGPLETLVSVLKPCLLQRRAAVVLLEGETGSGRRELVVGAAARLRQEVQPTTGVELAMLEPAGHGPRLLLLNAIEAADLTRVKWLAGQAATHGAVLVLPVHRAAPAVWRRHDLDGVEIHALAVPRLDRRQLTDAARMILQGNPTAALVGALMEESGGLAGRAVTLLRRWLAGGEVVWSVDGLSLRRGRPPQRPGPGVLLHRRLPLTTPVATAALGAMALANVPMTMVDLENVLCEARVPRCEEVNAAVISLLDAGLVELAAGGYRLANDDHGDELRLWLRPSIAARLHLAIAECLDLSELDHARHFVAAGRAEAVDAPVTGSVSRRRGVIAPLAGRLTAAAALMALGGVWEIAQVEEERRRAGAAPPQAVVVVERISSPHRLAAPA